MSNAKSYRDYEEFEREELRKLERLDVTYEELLSDFDTDEAYFRGRERKEGLFDSYEESDDACGDYGA
jgi:hypothetical protein